MKKETAEKILDSQFKELYYELMLTDQTGSNYLKAIQLIDDINNIMRKTKYADNKDKKYFDIAIVNEIYSDVVKEVMGIDCVASKKTVFVFQKTDSLLIHLKSKENIKAENDHSLEC